MGQKNGSQFAFIFKVFFAHGVLASAGVVYKVTSDPSNPTYPLHAIFVFLFLTALCMLIFKLKEIIETGKKKEHRNLAIINGFTSFLYFFLLLVAINSVGPSIAALILALGICVNVAVTIKAEKVKHDWSLWVFLVLVFLEAFLVQTKGKPELFEWSAGIAALVGAILCEAVNVYIRIVRCKAKNIDPGPIAFTGSVFALIWAMLILIVDFLFVSGIATSLSKITSYSYLAWGGWAYLALGPTVLMLTLVVRIEAEDAAFYHVTASSKFVIASLLLLFSSNYKVNSIFYDANLLIYSLVAIFVLSVVLFDRTNELVKKLGKTT